MLEIPNILFIFDQNVQNYEWDVTQVRIMQYIFMYTVQPEYTGYPTLNIYHKENGSWKAFKTFFINNIFFTCIVVLI